MKPRPRIRKTMKWGGAAVTVLLMLVWIGSRWFALGIEDGKWSGAVVTHGVLHLQWEERWIHDAPRQLRGVWKATSSPTWTGQYLWLRNTLGRDWFMLDIPLAWPIVLLLLASVIAWLLETFARRRARTGLCWKCSYSRAGLATDAVCPECGTAPAHP
jgi:hypothetical protein